MMKQQEILKQLTAIFATLPPEAKANVRGHLAAGTSILCGWEAMLYIDGTGAG